MNLRQNCFWICGKQPTWTHTYAITVDYTMLQTVYGLLVVMITSYGHCLTIIHIQSYRYKQWHCTLVNEGGPWKALNTYNVQVLTVSTWVLMCSFLQVTELSMDLRQANNMNWYKRNHVGWHAVANCMWSYDRHQDIMRTMSYNHTHTSIHIQSCNDVAHGGYENSFEKLCPSLVSVGPLVSAPATRAV